VAGSDAPNYTGFHLLRNDLGFHAHHPSFAARFENAMRFYSSMHEQEFLDFDCNSLGSVLLVGWWVVVIGRRQPVSLARHHRFDASCRILKARLYRSHLS